jgi:hypothetical protein
MPSSAATSSLCWPKAYESLARRDALAEAGITDRIMHRRHQAKCSPSWHKWMNVAITPLCGQTLQALRHHEAALPLLPRPLPWADPQPMSVLAALHGHEPARSGPAHRLIGIEGLARSRSYPDLPWIEQASSAPGTRRSATPCRETMGLRLSHQSPMERVLIEKILRSGREMDSEYLRISGRNDLVYTTFWTEVMYEAQEELDREVS